MASLGIQHTPIKVDQGVNQLVQNFQGNASGIAVGRLDTTRKTIQLILSDLKTMVDITGVGLETKKFVFVTIGGDHVPTKVIMSVIEEFDCQKLNSSGDAFYLLHFDEDVYKNQNHHIGTQLQGNYSSHTVYRVHIVAKLLLLMKCEELGDEYFWMKIKDLSLDWDSQDLWTAIIEWESIWKGIQNGVQFQERGGTGCGVSESGGSSHHSNSSFSKNCRNGKAGSHGNQGIPPTAENEDEMDGSDEEDGDSSGGKSLATSTNSMERECYSIEVRPGYDTFKIKEGAQWPHKSIHANVTPCVTVSFQKAVPFRNRSNKVIKGREVHVKLEVNLALGDSGPDDEEKHQFDWFHDYFEFSIQCTAKRAAQLKPHSGFIHKLKDQKAMKGRSSTLNSGHATIGTQGGVKLGPATLTQATGQVTYSETGDSTTIHVDEEALDSTRIQTAQGFDAVRKFEGGKRPSIGGKFSYGDTNSRSQCLREDGTCKKRTYNLPICSS